MAAEGTIADVLRLAGRRGGPGGLLTMSRVRGRSPVPNLPDTNPDVVFAEVLFGGVAKGLFAFDSSEAEFFAKLQYQSSAISLAFARLFSLVALGLRPASASHESRMRSKRPGMSSILLGLPTLLRPGPGASGARGAFF